MKRVGFILLIVSGLFLFSCSKNEVKENTPLVNDTLKINFKKNYTTLFPPKVADAISAQLVTQIYSGLVKYNPKNLKIEPAIAKSWSRINDTTFIFNIRNDVYFGRYEVLKDKPVKLTMDDILFTFQYLCTNISANKNFFSVMWRIKGAKKYYKTHNSLKGNFDIEGIKAINDSTLQIIIEDKDFPLLKVLANPVSYIFSKKAYKKLKEKTYVGAGAYQIQNVNDIKLNSNINDDVPPLILAYNPYFYGRDKNGNSLPYMAYVKVSFLKYEKKELDLLGEGALDLVMNVKKDNVVYFLNNYIKEVNSKNPKFILQNSASGVDDFVNIYKSSIKNFYSNELSYIDLSIIVDSNKVKQIIKN
jgi:oligopeptide transport system substrate-binding protein